MKYTFRRVCEFYGGTNNEYILFYHGNDDHYIPLDAVSKLGINDRLIQDIANLSIKDMINVTAAGYLKKNCEEVAYLVNDVAYTKTWAITDHREVESQVGQRALFTCTWTIKPVTAATKDKVPTRLRGDS